MNEPGSLTTTTRGQHGWRIFPQKLALANTSLTFTKKASGAPVQTRAKTVNILSARDQQQARKRQTPRQTSPERVFLLKNTMAWASLTTSPFCPPTAPPEIASRSTQGIMGVQVFVVAGGRAAIKNSIHWVTVYKWHSGTCGGTNINIAGEKHFPLKYSRAKLY